MYINSLGNSLNLGNELGEGGAAVVYHHASDKTKAIKIFKPEYLQKEPSLINRIDKLYKLEQIADFNMKFGSLQRSIGSWPKDIVKDRAGKIVGYVMDSVNGGVDLAHVVSNNFYKHRNSSNYQLWEDAFKYRAEKIVNRFILCYNLSHSFDKIYNIKTKQGAKLDLEICNFDIKPKNILVSIEKINNSNSIIPFILDLDNLTFKNKTGELGPAHPQFTPDYMAPEGPIDKYYDYYSIAVIFYQLIFDTHPFSVIGGTRFTDGTTTGFYVKNKCFAWGRNRKYLSQSTLNDFRHDNFKKIPTALQNLFIRAFDSDVQNNRPNMNEWKTAFADFISDKNIRFNQLFL